MAKKIQNSSKSNNQDNILAILAIIVGIIVIAWPQILGIAVGLYLVITGLLKLFKKN